MKVKELMEKLSTVSPEYEVFKKSEEDEFLPIYGIIIHKRGMTGELERDKNQSVYLVDELDGEYDDVKGMVSFC